MNPETQEQRVIEITRETCRKLDVKFSYDVAGSDESGLYLIPVYDRSWRKRRAQLVIASVMAVNAFAIAAHWVCGTAPAAAAPQLAVSLASIGVAVLVDRMPVLPWSVIHWHIDGELRAASFEVRRHSENAAEISYR